MDFYIYNGETECWQANIKQLLKPQQGDDIRKTGEEF